MTQPDQPIREQAIGPDGLTRRDRDLIREVLARYPDVRRVTLFGSRAMGTFGRGSDIDLALEGPDLTPRTLTRIATDLEDSDLPYKVDLLLRNDQLEPELKAHIRRHGQPFGWRQSTWGEEVSLEYGKALRGYSESNGEFRVFGTNGPIGWTDTQLTNGPGVILGRKGAYRGVHYSPEPFFVIDTAYYVVPKKELDMRWLYYAIIHYQLGQIDDGSPIPSTTRAAVYPREMFVPPPSEQRAIAAVLGALDDKIEQNRRTAQALERLARAIFRAWFVDFEPVKAKAAGATSFPSMPQPVFDALPTRFADSAIGPVPEGWEVGKLGDHCGINQRSVRSGEIEGEIEYVDISSVTVGRLTGIQRVPFSEAPSRARRRVRHGDTMWSCVRPNHRSYLFIHSPPEDRIVSTGFAVLSPSSFGASFLHEITTQPEFVHYLVSNADGSAYPAVRPDHFASAEILVPPQPFRDVFEELTMQLRDLLAAAERESATLGEMRDYLLPKLLSGAVRVNEAKRFADEVV